MLRAVVRAISYALPRSEMLKLLHSVAARGPFDQWGPAARQQSSDLL